MGIPSRQQSRMILKLLHVFSVNVWIGSGLAVLVLLNMGRHTVNGDELYAFNLAICTIDDFLIKPAAMMTYLTGFVAAVSSGGALRKRWLVLKLALTSAIILFGALYLGPCLERLPVITAANRLAVFDNNGYYLTYVAGSAAALVQTALLLLLIILSIAKPAGNYTVMNIMAIRTCWQEWLGLRKN